jgi:hypothetical protein
MNKKRFKESPKNASRTFYYRARKGKRAILLSALRELRQRIELSTALGD